VSRAQSQYPTWRPPAEPVHERRHAAKAPPLERRRPVRERETVPGLVLPAPSKTLRGLLELANGLPPTPVPSRAQEAPVVAAPRPSTPSEAGAPDTAVSPPAEDGVELLPAPTSLEVAPPTVASEEAFALIVPAGINARTKWLVATAVLGLLGAAALGLTLMRALSVSSAASAKEGARAAATVPAQPVHETAAIAAPSTLPLEPAAPPTSLGSSVPAADALPQATAESPTPASSSAIPWDDLPQTTSKTCEALAPLNAGPKAFLAGQAVTSAQRALVRGDATAAHAAFCTAEQLGVLNDTVLLGLTRVLFMQSDLAGALKAVDQLIERAPSNKQAFDLRGDILIRMGHVEEARQAWFKAAGATRASKLLVDNLIRSNDADAKLALRSGDLSRADRVLRRNIALTSGNPEHCRKLITVLLKNGNTAAADRWQAYSSARGD